ncbi:hypothetical protein B0F90DRAFT_1819566 [Multifurca ochricompacta]|uniref:Rap-GAP domain-containing protein n=1 Tax=Multifurca ochricompacta TaxID=376703 RepID=A0AAD4M022_9AGAM|nr:hypothetical protein B0F90DRAFT_1819566 [Multifurca ochricompacta]
MSKRVERQSKDHSPEHLNKKARFPLPNGFTPLQPKSLAQRPRVPKFRSDFTSSQSHNQHLSQLPRQKPQQGTRPRQVIHLETLGGLVNRKGTICNNDPLQSISADGAPFPDRNIATVASASTTRVLSPPVPPLLDIHPLKLTRVLEPPKIPTLPPRPSTPPKTLDAPDLAVFLSPRPSKPVSKTRIARAMDLWTESGRAELLGMTLSHRGVQHATPMEKAVRRGLEVSPRKVGIGKDIRFMGGGLAEHASQVIGRKATSHSLWRKSKSASLPESACMLLQIEEVLRAPKPPPQRGGVGMLLCLARCGTTSGRSSSLLVLFSVSPHDAKETRITAIEVGQGVALWEPLLEVEVEINRLISTTRTKIDLVNVPEDVPLFSFSYFDSIKTSYIRPITSRLSLIFKSSELTLNRYLAWYVPQEVEPPFRPRGRSNTNSFTNFPWRRGRNEPPPTTLPTAPGLSHSVEELITTLSPPAVPSLSTARILSAALANAPTVQLFSLTPVLASLCATDAPASLRAAGYDILTAFLERTPAPVLKASDRIALFSLFPARGQNAWHPDVWEARFRAFTAFTRGGTEIAGVETQLLEMLQTWIDAAFSGLLSRDAIPSTERVERERSVDLLGSFLTATSSRLETLARLSEPTIGNVLRFLGSLIERALALPTDLPLSVHVSLENPPGPHSSIPPTPTRAPQSHRRHHSSTSLPLASPVNPSPLGPSSRKPADIAITLYLDHLDAQARYLSPIHLKAIIPVLFRCLSFYASQLPRLSLSSSDQFETQFPLERRIVEALDPILNGPYTASCFLILRQHLVPRTGAGLGAWRVSVQTATGACRTLRIYVRRALCTRLARSYIAQMSAESYAQSGAPGGINLDHGLMERAWSKDEFTRGDLGKVGRILRRATEAWVSAQPEEEGADAEREEVLLEIAGALRDVFQEYDERANSYDIEVGEDETNVVGETLLVLARYIAPLKNADGSSFIVPLARPSEGPTPFLRTLSALLSRDHARTPCNPYLSTILLSISEHLVDSDTANVIIVMFERGDLSPIAHDWLANWSSILNLPEISSVARPLTRTALLDALQAVSATVRDVPMHRRPLVDLVMGFCVRQDYRKGERDGYEVVWNILADELVLRTIEAQEKERDASTEDADRVLEETLTSPMLDLLKTTAADGEDIDGDPTGSPAAQATPTIGALSSNVSPVSARGQFEYPGPQREKESSAMPAVMSLISSFATGASGATARSQLHAPPRADDSSSVNIPLSTSEPPGMPAALGAVVALVHIFAQLAFTPYSLSDRNRTLAVRVFRILVELVSTAKSARARLAILQFFFRLRVDRDHRLFSVYDRYDRLGNIAALAALIGRVEAPTGGNEPAHEEPVVDPQDVVKARARAPERNGRHASRGRDARPSRSTSSRSRSRVPNRHLATVPTLAEAKARKPIWTVPESLPFTIPESDTPSDGLVSYDALGPGNRIVLPVSSLILVVIDLILEEKDWEILSYVLCHLPTLLANKHFFCGPMSRAAIAKLLVTLCSKISQGDLASGIVNWPPGLKPRDAQGLACHTLSVLISYRQCFEPSRQHVLVEVLIAGLSGQPSTIKACLQALSLSAFELPNSMKRFLPNILTKLSQIMTNASMALHIIDLLAIVGSLPHLYANFTEADFKLVFGVALQYLRLHNRPEASPDTSWALSQHLRVMSYYIVYLWFLALKLPDRPKHVKYITRQLLLANEGQDDIDEPAEVCFDWLARYTYASADPRPASSMLNDIVMSPVAHKNFPESDSMGRSHCSSRIWPNAILARIENVPMVGPGEVDPDMLSVPAMLSMSHDILDEENELYQDIIRTFCPEKAEELEETPPPRPDPITGYVWQGSAPSQRRKDVAVDPSFFALQLSTYGPNAGQRRSKVVDTSGLPALFRTLDLMPVIDTHKVGIMAAYNLRGQVDVYAGGLDPDEDGEYAYAWWDDIGQILYHTATLMPNHDHDPHFNYKKRHIGNDLVRIIWNDSGIPYRFDTLSTQFQFVNIVIEPHSLGAIAAFSNNLHENEYFRVTVQRAPGMAEFTPIGNFKLMSAKNLPLLVRQLSLLGDWFASVFQQRRAIKRFRAQMPPAPEPEDGEGIMLQESSRDFTVEF